MPIEHKGKKVWSKKEIADRARKNLALARQRKKEKAQVKQQLQKITEKAIEGRTSTSAAEEANNHLVRAFFDKKVGGYEGFIKWVIATNSNTKEYYTKILPKALERLLQPNLSQKGVIFNLIGLDKGGNGGESNEIKKIPAGPHGIDSDIIEAGIVTESGVPFESEGIDSSDGEIEPSGEQSEDDTKGDRSDDESLSRENPAA
jgi:hypothetical protein